MVLAETGIIPRQYREGDTVREARQKQEYVGIRIDIADGCGRILSAIVKAGAFPARKRQEALDVKTLGDPES